MPRPCQTLLLLLLLPLLALRARAGGGWVSAAPGANIAVSVVASDSGSCIIPFNRVGNLMVIQARVDSTVGNFILDTGAPGLVLNQTYFRDYPVSMQHDEQETSINGRGSQKQHTAVAELLFGTLRFFRLQADVSQLGNIENAKGIKVLGLLGLGLFRDCEMMIDFDAGQIHLRRLRKKEAATYQHQWLTDTAAYRTFAIEFSNGRMITNTEVAGKKLKLVIDCAAEANILDSRLPEPLLELITITGRVKLTAPGERKAEALYGNLQRMTMGSRQIDNLPVVLVNLAYTCFSDDMCVNGVLGADFLSRQRIGFNFVTRKMYIWK